jgi:murein L,D-transpeptidase YcbB/YkuD
MAASIQTFQVTLTLPRLERDSQPPPPKEATARVQAIFNDFAKAENKPRPFGESGAFGPTTQDHVEAFQQKHGLTKNGIVGPKTWTALLTTWIKLRALPLDSDDNF